MAIRKPIYQMSFDLDLPEPESTEWINPVDVALREEAARHQFEGGAEKPDWYEEYEELVQGGWNFRVAMYIAWAATPRKGRMPKTLPELASLMGLNSPRAIYVWRQRNQVIDDQVAIMQAAPLFKHRAGVYQTLADVAADPDYKHAPDRRLFAQLVGDIGDGSDVTVRSVQLTGDDLVKAKQATGQFESERFGDADDPGFVETVVNAADPGFVETVVNAADGSAAADAKTAETGTTDEAQDE